MSTRSLVIGLDGADLALVEQLGPRRLPHLHGLMERGAFAALQSVRPPATLPNWTTFLTGLNPGRHGVFDFTTRRGYSVRFTAGGARMAPTVAARLDRLGMRCACLFFPATYPPEELQHGLFISGWDAPVAFEADRSFVHPQAMYEELVNRFGIQRFCEQDEFETDRPGWHRQLPETLRGRIARRAELCCWLLESRDWDLFAVYFGESDTASHHLWALHDPGSPRRPAQVDGQEQEGLGRVYEALDAALGSLLATSPNAEVSIVSDHGFGGSSDRVLYLNRALADAGLLRLRPAGAGSKLVGQLKELALTRLTPALRERAFRLAGGLLPGLLESRARFASIDMRHTRMFSDELNYFPAIHYNLKGREPHGQLDPADVPAALQTLREALASLRDPWSGQPVVRKVYERQELFEGPYVDRAPDLLLELNLPDGYSYNLMPSAGAPPGCGSFRRLTPDEYLGRKGRSLQGRHRARGLYVAAGPRVAPVGEVKAHMADATRTLLRRLEVDDGDLDGRVLAELLVEAEDPVRPLPQAQSPAGLAGDETRVEARLRNLGYIE